MRTPLRLRYLKAAQLAVAIATVLVLGAGLLLPGAMGFLLVPFGVLYVFWAVRTLYDRRWSIRFAFASTIVVAIAMSTLGGAMVYGALRSHGAYMRQAVVVDATGAVIERLSPELPEADAAQIRIDLRERAQTAIFLLVGGGAWTVLTLYALEWQWALQRHNGR